MKKNILGGYKYMSNNNYNNNQELQTTDNALVNPEEKSMYTQLKSTKLKFDKDLSVQERTILAKLAISYDLNPFIRHICVLYSKPYVTNKGLLHLLNKSGRALTKRTFDYIKITYDEKKQETTAYVTMYIAPSKFTAPGYIKYCIKKLGLTYKEALEMMKVQEKGTSNPRKNKLNNLSEHAETMAIKDAENKMLRRLLSIGLQAEDDAYHINKNESKNLVDDKDVIDMKPEPQPEIINDKQNSQIAKMQAELVKNGASRADVSMWNSSGILEQKYNEMINKNNTEAQTPVQAPSSVETPLEANPIKYITELEASGKAKKEDYFKAVKQYFNNHAHFKYQDFLNTRMHFTKDKELKQPTIAIYKEIIDYITNDPDNFKNIVNNFRTMEQAHNPEKEKQKQSTNPPLQGEIV